MFKFFNFTICKENRYEIFYPRCETENVFCFKLESHLGLIIYKEIYYGCYYF